MNNVDVILGLTFIETKINKRILKSVSVDILVYTKYSCIQETKSLLSVADSSTDTFYFPPPQKGC